jgi:hypothetical protein
VRAQKVLFIQIDWNKSGERASRRVDYLRFSCQRALAKWREYIKKSARRYPAAPCRRCIFISRSQEQHTVYMFVKYFFKRTMMKRLFPRRMRCRLFSCASCPLFLMEDINMELLVAGRAQRKSLAERRRRPPQQLLRTPAKAFSIHSTRLPTRSRSSSGRQLKCALFPFTFERPACPGPSAPTANRYWRDKYS